MVALHRLEGADEGRRRVSIGLRPWSNRSTPQAAPPSALKIHRQPRCGIRCSGVPCGSGNKHRFHRRSDDTCSETVQASCPCREVQYVLPTPPELFPLAQAEGELLWRLP